MSSLSAKDRVPLCSFTFSDGRRCRTPRIRNHPHFCFYHAQKEARARAAQKLGKDLAYFFSGDYLSACDLSTALARLIPAVVRGDVKPGTAHTLAYLAQTLMQAIHISQDEYINAFGTDDWRKSIRNSVNGNYAYRFPPGPAPEQSAVSALRTNLRSESPQPQPQPQPTLPPTQAQQPASAPPSTPPQTPSETPMNCHSKRSEDLFTSERFVRGESASSESTLSPISPHAPQTPAPHSTPSSPGCHAERSEASHPILATQSAPSAAAAAQPKKPLRTCPSTPRPTLTRDTHALHFDHNCRLLIDGKPF